MKKKHETKMSGDEINTSKKNTSAGWILNNIKKIALSILAAATVTFAAIIIKNNNPKNEDTNKSKVIAKDSLLRAEFYKNESSAPCINPPLKDIYIPFSINKLNAEKGGVLNLKSGSKLVVPNNAFSDENGILIKGDVELYFREFHDAVDFFISGIPMTYDSAGTRYQFESAGMIEIKAYQKEKPINIDAGKSINIELASQQKGNDYNLYVLDTTKNNWSCLKKGLEVAKKEGFENTTGKSEIVKVAIKETPEYKALETRLLKYQTEKDAQVAALFKDIEEPKKPIPADKNKFTFNLEVDSKEYPELALYKGVLFEVGVENKSFSKKMYDITWDEVIIKEGPLKGGNYLLKLKKEKKVYDIVVYPVFEGVNYQTAINSFQDKFVAYNLEFEKRKKLEKKLEEDYQVKIIALKKQQENDALNVKNRQSDYFKLMSAEEKMKRMFAINSFGIYNCDNPIAYPKGISCSANLINEKEKKMMSYDVFLVDRFKNSLFSFVKNPIVNFSFDPKSVNLLWTVENGILYWLKPEQFNELKISDEKADLKMNRVDEKFKTVDEIKAYFNF